MQRQCRCCGLSTPRNGSPGACRIAVSFDVRVTIDPPTEACRWSFWRLLGTICGAGGDCCSNFCGANGLCSLTGFCKSGGSGCSSATECCSGLCTNNLCATTQCGDLGAACTSGTQCCTRSCGGDAGCTSAPGSTFQCKSLGAGCDAGSNCCSSLHLHRRRAEHLSAAAGLLGAGGGVHRVVRLLLGAAVPGARRLDDRSCVSSTCANVGQGCSATQACCTGANCLNLSGAPCGATGSCTCSVIIN